MVVSTKLIAVLPWTNLLKSYGELLINTILFICRDHTTTTEITITINKLFDNHYSNTDITLLFILTTCCLIIISCIGLEVILYIILNKSIKKHREVTLSPSFTQDPYYINMIS